MDTANLPIATSGMLMAAGTVWVATLAGLYSAHAPRRRYLLSPLLAQSPAALPARKKW